MLPILALQMQGPKGLKVKFNVLFDTASSRSYIDYDIAKKLKLNTEYMSDMVYEVRTFLGCGTKVLKETVLRWTFPMVGCFHCQFL